MTRPSAPSMLPSSLMRAVLLVAASALAACNKAPPAPPAMAPGGGPPVTAAAAIERDILETDEFAGRFEATERVQIRARVTGYLKAIHFQPGSEVAAGDLLVEIDPAPFEARLAEAEAAAANTRAQLKLARLELARQAKMLPANATSRRDYDAAAAQVAALEAAAQADQARIQAIRVDLGYTRITAPIAGRIGKDELTVGNLVRGDMDATVLTTLVALDPIYATFEADEGAYLKYIGAARAQQLKVSVGLANEDGAPHPATLSFVDNQLDTTSGTLRLRATIANPERRFTPGLFARVKLASGTGTRRAVMVVDSAIGTDQSKRFVLVLDADKKAQYREVQLGRVYGGLRVIEQGVKAGEQVVINGLQRVRPGSPVTPEMVEMPVPVPAALAPPAEPAPPAPVAAPATAEPPKPAAPAPAAAAEVPPKPVAAAVPAPVGQAPYSLDWLLQQPRSRWVVQVAASADRRDVDRLLARHGLTENSVVFKAARDGRDWYHAVHGLYDDLPAAQAAIAALPTELRQRTQPWPRSLRTLATLAR